MGSAETQGELWGVRSRDWAELQEQTTLPLHLAALDAANVTRGKRFLDAGCGSGIVALLAQLRGAEVSAIDASESLLQIARQRLSGSDVRRADLEALPYEDRRFDSVVAINSVFYAADTQAAMRELARVVASGGRLVITSWGPPEKCDYGAVMKALAPLMPPPPPGSANAGPFALAAPGALEGLLEMAGLRPVVRGEVTVPFHYPELHTSWTAQASSGVAQRAIRNSGEDAVRAAITEMDRNFLQPDGSIHYNNAFIWSAGERP